MPDEKVKEVVGIFDDKESLDSAVAELEVTNFSRDKLSVLGSQKAMEEHFGKAEVPPEKAEDDPDAPRSPPVHPEEETLGTAAIVGGGAYVGAVGLAVAAGAAFTVPAVLTAAALGGGAGGVLAKLLGDYYTGHIENQIEKGGLLLWVQTPTADEEEQAKQIIEKHGGHDVHVREGE